ncbi:DUF1349 domain-containing protein [Streptomyces sp. B6B3]|uniref:DUF1349 domain-containing protein n=1 Tax=Streptomyces sp. B6B3 TaxID=3153570 RepID=UPI00325E9034
MTTTTDERVSYRSTVEPGGDGFGRLLLAEWTKLRSVPRWRLTLLAAVVLTALVALLAAGGTANQAGGGGGGGDLKPAGPGVQDAGHYVHQPLTGDGSLVARVAAQRDSHPWAKAGLMVRADAVPGTPYAAVMVTPDHGLRLQHDFGDDVARAPGSAPYWLRLTRAGDSVTAYASGDGADWSRIGTVELTGLPETVTIGLFVASPDDVEVQRAFGAESISSTFTEAEATFDGVRLTAEQPGEQAGEQPSDAAWRDGDPTRMPGETTRSGDTFTLTGTGDIGPYEFGDDTARDTLSAVLVGLMAVITLAVLFGAAEYRWGAIRATLAASPRRGRALAAKAVVLAGVTFLTGALAACGALLLSAPLRESNGLPTASLAEGPVLRAALGTAALVALVALFSLGVATALRRGPAAITVVLLLVLVPQIVSSGLPLSAAAWLDRLSPAAGFAIQQTVPRYDTAIGPWAGLGVTCCYAAVALAFGGWRLRRSDV